MIRCNLVIIYMENIRQGTHTSLTAYSIHSAWIDHLVQMWAPIINQMPDTTREHTTANPELDGGVGPHLDSVGFCRPPQLALAAKARLNNCHPSIHPSIHMNSTVQYKDQGQMRRGRREHRRTVSVQ